MSRILIIEDNEAIRYAIRDVLETEGHEVLLAECGATGLKAACAEDPAAILLDIILPEMDGYEVLRRLRADGVEAPVMMISAKGQEIDKVLALELGADDYLTKPFGMAELLARVKAQLRRAQLSNPHPARGIRRQADLEIDLDARTVTKNGSGLALTRTEFDILALLSGSPGRVFTRREILAEVWGYEHFPTSRTLDNHIFELRHKIEDDPTQPSLIQSVRGIGYRMTET
jgi:two-component system, OmpR family, response regulator VicR